MALLSEKILPVLMEDEMKSSYLDYSMSVIVSRALPDVRDGLKPVHRRILYAMSELGMDPTKPHKKSARLVGEVLGKYHPHGDTAVYDALVRLAQPWSMRYPLVDGQGNFGSIDGDPPAAMRYTEVRFATPALDVLRDIDKQTVDFRANFDDSLEEPTVLPTVLPTLLVNGAGGIAVGMATNIPPHNLKEITEGIKAFIANPEITIDELVTHVKAPDFPTGGIIYGYNGVADAYKTGRGKIVIRARVSIEKSKSGRESIIISEIPYQVNKTTLIEKIASLTRQKVLDGISDIRDESDRDGMRLVIELKKDAKSKVVLNALFKHSQLQQTFGVILLALQNGRPKIFTLKELISAYVEHRIDVIVKRTKFDLNAAEKRAHILEGYLKVFGGAVLEGSKKIASERIDEIVAIIKKAESIADASTKLQASFELSELQAKAILELRLQRLTSLEREKIANEYTALLKEIKRLRSILSSKELQLHILVEELEAITKQYGDDRRTEILYDTTEMKFEDTIANEDVVVTMTHQGLIKRTPMRNYKSSKSTKNAMNPDDFLQYIFATTTHNFLLFFTDKGRCYRVKIFDLPEGGKSTKGRSIANCIQKDSNEKIISCFPVKEFVDDAYIFFSTKNGTVKRVTLSAFANVRANGVIAVDLGDDDTLIGASMTNGECDIILGTKKGMACRFRETEVRPMGRQATGVIGINLDDSDEVVSAIDIKRGDVQLLVLSERGIGKRSEYEDIRLTRRGAKGVKSLQLSPKTGDVIGIVAVNDSEDLITISVKNDVQRYELSQIGKKGSVIHGTQIVPVSGIDPLVSMVVVIHDEDDGLDNDDEPKPHVPTTDPLQFEPQNIEPIVSDFEESLSDIPKETPKPIVPTITSIRPITLSQKNQDKNKGFGLFDE